MKSVYKSFVFFSFLVFALSAFAQNPILQGSVVNTAPNKVVVYLKPDVSMNNVSFTSVTISISIPDQSPGVNPTMTVTNTFGNNLGWITEFNANAQTTGHSTPVLTGGRAYYTFFGNDANANVINITGGTAFPLVEFTFDRTGITDNTVQLNDLSSGGYGNGGGPTNSAFFFVDITGTAGSGIGRNTNVPQMFFGAAGTVTNNGGASPSTVSLQSALAPVALKEFNVSKQGTGNALLTWTTTYEQNASHFIIERSIKESNNWVPIVEVKAKGNSSIDTKYSFTDLNVYDGREIAKTIFYRLKQIDLNAAEKVFPVRSVRFTALGDKEINIFPNPAQNGFYIQIPTVLRTDMKVRLSLVNRLGQVVETREINAALASNYYFDITAPSITSGDYALDIIYDGQKLATKKVMVNR
jgi:hypothetical protein